MLVILGTHFRGGRQMRRQIYLEAAIRLVAAVLAMTILAGCSPQSSAEQAGPEQVIPAISHPLDPLTKDEYIQTVALLRAAGHVNDSSRFSSLELLDPEKTIVQAWQPGDDFGRAAFAVVKQGLQTFEVTAGRRTGIGGEKGKERA